jgi:hypothetical protein
MTSLAHDREEGKLEIWDEEKRVLYPLYIPAGLVLTCSSKESQRRLKKHRH